MFIRPFVLFASDRSGSTTLRRVINAHPLLGCIHEPFNETNGCASLQANSISELRTHLDLLRMQFPGFKHVWWLDGWPVSSREWNLEIATYGNPRVILLDRRNILQRAVSRHIAQENNIWLVQDRTGGQRDTILGHKYQPIDPEWLSSYMRQALEEAETYRREVIASGVEYVEVWYEDLYGDDVTIDERLRRVASIISFLGAEPNSAIYPLAYLLLDPANSKYNSDSTYHLIPNIDEIDREFSGEEFGYLLSTSPRQQVIPAYQSRTGALDHSKRQNAMKARMAPSGSVQTWSANPIADASPALLGDHFKFAQAHHQARIEDASLALRHAGEPQLMAGHLREIVCHLNTVLNTRPHRVATSVRKLANRIRTLVADRSRPIFVAQCTGSRNNRSQIQQPQV